jgi:hypothetical protein
VCLPGESGFQGIKASETGNRLRDRSLGIESWALVISTNVQCPMINDAV